MIYCVEDDSSSRELMLYTLKTAGFRAEGFPDAGSFHRALRERVPDLVILDIMLPDEDGITILKKLRRDSRTEDLPVIMATAKGTEYDKVIGLDLGADDYLAKPFGMMEMVSRVKAVLRRAGREKAQKQNVLRIGGVEMDTASHSVKVHGEETELTLKEYDLLKLFMENPGRAFTREALLMNVWDSEYAGETRTVDVHVGTLRTKLGDQAALIRTIRGVGYRMENEL